MVCPFCFKTKTHVVNSRVTKKINNIWRRRACDYCNKRFTTTETVDPSSVLHVEGKPFLTARLLASLLKACDHRKDKETAADYILESVLQSLYTVGATNKQNLTKKDIVDCVLKILANYDSPAQIKYLSYHTPYLDKRTIKRQL